MEGNQPAPAHVIAAGEKAKARDILAAIRTLKTIEQEQRPATPDERQALARFGGFGAGGPVDLPRPGHRPLQGRGWQALGEELQIAADARGIRQRQAHHLQRLLHLAHRHRRPCTTALARLGVPADATVLEPGCGTGNFMDAAPEGMRFIGVELDWHLRPHRPRPPPAGRHPHRELPRHQAARRPHRRGDRQRAVRRRQARLRRPEAVAARFLLRQVGRRPETRRRPRPGHQPFHARQAECGHPRVPRRAGRFPGSDPAALRCLQARRHARRHRHRVPAQACRRRAGQPRRPGLAGDAAARHRRRRHPDQPLLPEPPGDGAGHLEPQGPALRRRLQRRSATATWPSSSATADPAGCPRGSAPSRCGARSKPPAVPAFTPAAAASGISPKAVSSSATTASSARSKAARPSPSPTAARCSNPTAR